MKVHYNKQEDIFMIELDEKKIDHAYETKNMIVHVSENREPVLLEIFNASKFFAEEAKILPSDIKQKFFSTTS